MSESERRDELLEVVREQAAQIRVLQAELTRVYREYVEVLKKAREPAATYADIPSSVCEWSIRGMVWKTSCGTECDYPGTAPPTTCLNCYRPVRRVG